MKVGFTGTRKGMSKAQTAQLMDMLRALERATPVGAPREFHHGGADGADSEADQLAHFHGYVVHLHPCPGVCADAEPRAANGYGQVRRTAALERGRFNGHQVEWKEVLPPLVRNRNIVAACDVLIAAPETDKEQQRSGTWATVRYARAAGKPVVMLSRGAA